MRTLFTEPLALLVLLALVALSLVPADEAAAQAGPGAERYEVTITPPKRPGSEPAAEATTPAAPGEGPSPAAPADAAAAKAPAADADNVLGGAQAASVPAAPPAATAPSANLPLRTLQVGAFRQHDSAEELRGQLASRFQDVTIFEISSGGEPLYRVNVGRLPKGPELAELKRRLSEAGYPAFDVPAPRIAAGQ